MRKVCYVEVSRAVEQADAYLADELTKWQRIQFLVCIWLCRHCRRYVRQLKRLKSQSATSINDANHRSASRGYLD